MAKATKGTKKFVKSKLKGVIKDRKTFQKKNAPIIKAKQDREARLRRRGSKKGAAAADEDGDEAQDDDDDDSDGDEGAGQTAMTVDDFLGGGFRQGMDAGDDDEEGADDADEEEDADLDDLEDIEDEENAMKAELAKLQEKDPEFYKFLQDNDKDLLAFGADDDEDMEVDEDEDEDEDDQPKPASKKKKEKAQKKDAGPQLITNKLLTQWKRALIQNHSVKSLRKLLLAFRSAARLGQAGGDEDNELAYAIDNAAMFNKVVMTTLRYTPVVLQHHLPYKTLPNGKFKLPTNDKKYRMLQAAVKSFASNLVHLLKTLPDPSTVFDVVTESSKMIPYLMPIRRSARDYVNTLINLWSTAQDNVRISAFLAVRKAAMAGEAEFLDFALRATYRALVNSSKQTTVYNLPTIHLMKNSATELFGIDSTASYQHAFGYVRQLAIHLRQTLKNTRAKESRQAVCSWQYIHCLDFWSLVLSKSCDVAVREEKGESVMQPLIYPLVQVAMGVMRLVPTSTYIPLRLHIIRSMIRLAQRTGAYIPLFPFFTQLFESAEFQGSSKGSTLKPLDLETTLRASDAYVRTRVYADQVAEELVYLFTEFLASQARSIAFPEMVIPLLVQVKRQLRTCSNPKLVSSVKSVLEKTAQNSTWVASKRAGVDFAPNSPLAIGFLTNEKGEAPLEAAARLSRKVREQKRKLLEQTRQENGLTSFPNQEHNPTTVPSAAQHGHSVPFLQHSAARADPSAPPLEPASASAAGATRGTSINDFQRQTLINAPDGAATASVVVDAQSIADAGVAPTRDEAWPPTLEEWHESREEVGTRITNHMSAKSSQPIAVASEPLAPSSKGKDPAPPSSLSSSVPRSIGSPNRSGSIAQVKPSKVQQLPQEVLMRLFSFLDPFGLASVALVCRNWAKVAMDDSTWRGAFAIYFGLDWGSDEIRAPLKLARGGNDEAQQKLPDWLKGTDPASSMRTRSIALRRLRPAKWKQEFIARWELARRWRKTKTQPISTNPSISTISQVAFAPPTSSHASSFLLSSSLVYGVACRSDPFTGRRISMGFLDASGNTNGAGIGNPNVEFSPDVTAIAMGADARSIVWGFRTGQVSLTLLSKQGTNPRGLVRSIRFDQQTRHRGAVLDIALPLAAGNEGGARSVVRSPTRLAQHLSDLGELAATFVSAGEDGTVRLWAWPLEKSHGNLGVGASSGHIANNRKLPLWMGTVMDGAPLVPSEERRLPPSISKVAFSPVMGIIVAGSADGTLIVWSNLNVSRLVAAPAAAFSDAMTTSPNSNDTGIAEWREELQQIYGAVQVTRFSADASRSPSQGETRRVADIEIAAPSTRRVGDKVDDVSIIVRLEGDSVLRRFDVAFRGQTASTSDGKDRPWDRESYPQIRAYIYGFTGSESPITTFRSDFDTLSSNDRSRPDPSAASSASPSPAPRSPSMLPTIPARRNVDRVISGSSSKADRDPVRFTLPISAAYVDQLKIGDRG
ncbi:hypothetical protein A4X09_0g5520, partial [Tilletia walkeri]